MTDRTLTEREALRAARYFLEQFSEREGSDVILLLIHWMDEVGPRSEPPQTADPAQWSDWTVSVDRALAERPLADDR